MIGHLSFSIYQFPFRNGLGASRLDDPIALKMENDKWKMSNDQ